MTFFEWQLEKLQPIPQTSDADLDLTLGQKPSLRLGKRDKIRYIVREGEVVTGRSSQFLFVSSARLRAPAGRDNPSAHHGGAGAPFRK